MKNTRLVAYALIAIGAIALVSRLSTDVGWLWVGLVAAGFLAAYARGTTYSFLVIGAILLGVAVGLLFEGSWHIPGAFLVSVGLGIAAIGLVEPRPTRWPRWLGGLLVVLGVVAGLAQTGVLGSAAFALLLILAGAVLLSAGRRRPADVPRAEDAANGPAAAPTQPTDASLTPPPAAVRPSSGAAGAPGAAAPAPGEAPPTWAAPGEPAPGEGALRDQLLAWRRETADREGRAVGLVLADDTVEQLARERPQDLTALGRVYGIGPVRLERYGAELLSLLRMP